MDSKELFSILNSILWQDYKGFVRDEKDKDKDYTDIEATVNDIKIIRNKRGKMGLCQWKKYTSCCILCKSKYDNIKRLHNDTFIMEKKGRYGLYSGFMMELIAECRYDKIEPLSDEVFALYYKGGMSKINYKGDRILL